MAASWRVHVSPSTNDRKSSKSLSRYGQNRRRESRSRRPKSMHHSRSLSPRPAPAWPVHQPASAMTASPSLSFCPSIHLSVSRQSTKMERTPSGNTILLDEGPLEPCQDHTFLHEADLAAANGVFTHFRHSLPNFQHVQSLYNLIYHSSSFDDETISNILTAADAVFFHDTLKGRVRWEWSSAPRYHDELVGTTALRECRDLRGGVECLIVLSSPLLKGGNFSRRLGVGVFLHELIHAFLFIRCGFTARIQGGHTNGFHMIAGLIDDWVGRGHLRLCSMKANLSYFRKGDGRWEEVVEDDLYSDPAFPVFKDGERGCWRNGEEGSHYDGEEQSLQAEWVYDNDADALGGGYEYFRSRSFY